MLKEIQVILDKINGERRNQKKWQKVVSILACLTIFCTTYALILPAITLEASPDAICGKEEHTHTAECYTRTPVLVCTEDHEHTDECYVMESVLVCGKEEHKHSAACFPKEEPKAEEKVEAKTEEPAEPTESVEPSDLPAEVTEEVKAEDKTSDEGEAVADEVKSEDKKAEDAEDATVEDVASEEEAKSAEETEDTQTEEEEELEEYETKTFIRKAGLIKPKMMKSESESPMQLKKTVSSKPNDDGYYTITLEAYAKGSGSIEFHTSVAPTDIVLVLDQSGSMDDTMGGRRKYEILQEAVKNFIDQVIESVKGSDGELETPDDVAHRIAMVGFSGSNSDYTGVFLKSKNHKIKKMSIMTTNDYKNAFYDMTDDDDREDIYKAKNNIGVDAATYINLGMQMAKKIFDNNKDSTRNRLVVVFTDGVPGASRTGGWYYNPSDDQQDSGKNAEAAIATSNQLKSNYKATVYSIGIFAGADASKNGTMWDDSTWTFTEAAAAPYANYFMHHLSSNYNSKGEQVDTRYYMSASNANALMKAFEAIATAVESGGSQNTELKENTTVIDAVSDYFEFPEGADKNDVKVYTVDSNAVNGTEPVFDEGTKEPLAAEVAFNDGKMSVKGFDYSANWCGAIKKGDTYTAHPGKKIVIEVPVKPKDDFIGGYDVPTNKDNSGVYLNGEQIGTFEVPTTDVAFKGEAYAAEKTVYYGTEVSMDDLYFSNEGLTKKLWDKLTDYVDFIKTNGHKSGNYYVIGNTEYEIELPDFTGSASNAVVQSTETDAHTVKIRMRKKSPAGEWKGYNVSAKINVLVPELKWKDNRVLSGETYTSALCLEKNKVSEDWIPDGDWTPGEGGVPEAEGTAPKLKLSFVNKSTAETIGTEPYTIVDDTKVDVNVQYNLGEDVINATDVTSFKWECGLPAGHGNCANIPEHKGATGDPEFWIHAYVGRTLPATGGSGIKLLLIVGLTLMTGPIMIGLSIKRRLALIKVF
jgi:AAA ATPase containing von Willebrand factor type A (vWA) domain